MRTAPTSPTVDPGHHGPSGHGEIGNPRGLVHGVVTTLEPPPVKGAFPSCPPADFVSSGLDLRRVPDTELQHGAQHIPHDHWALPKLDFPQFNGENPQFWKNKCEKYFDMYVVHLEMWVRGSTLPFIGNAARWL